MDGELEPGRPREPATRRWDVSTGIQPFICERQTETSLFSVSARTATWRSPPTTPRITSRTKTIATVRSHLRSLCMKRRAFILFIYLVFAMSDHCELQCGEKAVGVGEKKKKCRTVFGGRGPARSPRIVLGFARGVYRSGAKLCTVACGMCCAHVRVRMSTPRCCCVGRVFFKDVAKPRTLI